MNKPCVITKNAAVCVSIPTTVLMQAGGIKLPDSSDESDALIAQANDCKNHQTFNVGDISAYKDDAGLHIINGSRALLVAYISGISTINANIVGMDVKRWAHALRAHTTIKPLGSYFSHAIMRGAPKHTGIALKNAMLAIRHQNKMDALVQVEAQHGADTTPIFVSEDNRSYAFLAPEMSHKHLGSVRVQFFSAHGFTSHDVYTDKIAALGELAHRYDGATDNDALDRLQNTNEWKIGMHWASLLVAYSNRENTYAEINESLQAYIEHLNQDGPANQANY